MSSIGRDLEPSGSACQMTGARCAKSGAEPVRPPDGASMPLRGPRFVDT